MAEDSTSLGVTIQADEATLTKSAGNIMSAKDNGITLAKLEHGTLGDILLYGATGTPARLGVGARGEILFYNATTLAKLGVGTSGQFLKSQGAGADPIWANAGTMQKVAETIVTGSAVTQIDFDGVDLEADKNYLLIIYTESAVDSYIQLQYNDDGTATNYHIQRYQANSTNVTSIRVNDGKIAEIRNGHNSICCVRISKNAGEQPYAVVQNACYDPANLELENAVHAWTTTTNVTKINLVADNANALGVGTRATLFRLVS